MSDWFCLERATKELTYQYAPVPLRRGMTLQRTLSSLGEAEDPTRYSLIFEFAGTGKRKVSDSAMFEKKKKEKKKPSPNHVPPPVK
jgi:hypothetical protein